MLHQKHIQEVSKTLECIMSKGYSNYDIMHDFIGLMFYAFQRDDENYLKIMGRYRNEGKMGSREADYFAKALGQLLIAMKETDDEYIGELFMTYASSQYRGQFFTPAHVCQMMAKLTGGVDSFPTTGKVYVGDPCCGAGAMLLSFGKELLMEQASRVVFVAQDIDFYCCQMTALNLMFYNYNAIIIHGDSLALKVRSAWRTKRSLLYGGSIEVMDVDEAKSFIEASFLSQGKAISFEEQRAMAQEIKSASQNFNPFQLLLF